MPEPVDRNDPDLPGYQAPYRPDDPREVGTGKDFGADLFALYRAGRVYFPETATRFSEWTSRTHDLAQRVQFLSDSVGGERALGIVEQIRADLHFALRETSITMRDVGTALVQISTDFAQTDESAAGEFNRLVTSNPGLLNVPTPQVPPPPGGESPYETPYEGPSLEAPEPEPWPLAEFIKDELGDALAPVQDGVEDAVDGVRGWFQEQQR